MKLSIFLVSVALYAQAPQQGSFISAGTSGGGGACSTLAGDVTGSCSANTVVKINGGAAPTDSALGTWNGSGQPVSSGIAPANVMTVLNAKGYGCVGDDSTNNDACITAMLTAANSLGGGKLFFPPGTYLANSEIFLPAHDSVTPVPNQVNIELQGVAGGAGNFSSGNTSTTLTASVLDLRYTNTDGSGKIEGRGKGNLVIDSLTIKDGGSANATPLIHVTNTTLLAQNSVFYGSGSTTQDAIVLGSPITAGNFDPNYLVTGPFQGYGTIINGNQFQNLAAGVHGRMYANSIGVTNNVWFGNLGYAAIIIDGSDDVGASGIGWNIHGNLIEIGSIQYGVDLISARGNQFDDNTFWDKNSGFISNYHVDAQAFYNKISDAIVFTSNPNGQLTITGAAAGLARTSIYQASSTTLDSTGNGYASTEMAGGAIVKGQWITGNVYQGSLTVSDTQDPLRFATMGVDDLNNLFHINAMWDGNPMPLLFQEGGGQSLFGNISKNVASGSLIRLGGNGLEFVGATQPTCDANHLGLMNYSGHVASVADTVAFCVQNASNAYAETSMLTGSITLDQIGSPVANATFALGTHVLDFTTTSGYFAKVSSGGGLQSFTTGANAWANFGSNSTSTPSVEFYDASNVPQGFVSGKGFLGIGNGTATIPAGTILALGSGYQFQVDTSGNAFYGLGQKSNCTHGSNATCGVGTLSSGVLTVPYTPALAAAAPGGAGSDLKYWYLTGGTSGWLGNPVITSGTGFTVTCYMAPATVCTTDSTSTVYWEIGGIQ